METTAIQTSLREGTGKGTNRRLRAEGKMPAVLYGHGIEAPVNVVVDPRNLEMALRHPKGFNALLPLNVEGAGAHEVLVREVQRHPVSRRIQHVDFVAPDPAKEIVSVVPLKITGKSIGVSLGGRLRTPYKTVKVVSLPKDIPASIDIDITELNIMDETKASELNVAEGARVLFDRDFVVVKVVQARGAKKKEEEEEG
ncbi:MAG: 50S ribosomal protein L25 [Bradymonadia bacterium]